MAMIRAAFLSVVVILISLAASSCDRGAYRELADIESYAAERPDSALQALGKIDSRRIRRAKVRAGYCLLKSMTLDKNYIDVTDDSLTLEAVRWYRDHGTDAERARAYYYHGRVQQNDKDYVNAIIAFTNAEKYAGADEDWLYLGLIYRGMAEIYGQNYNFADEYKYAQLSCDCFHMAENENFYNYGLLDIAASLNNQHKYAQSDSICQKIIKIAKGNHDIELYRQGLRMIALTAIKSDTPEPEKTIEIFSYLIDSLDYVPTISDYSDLAHAYSLDGNYEYADSIIENIEALVGYDKISQATISLTDYVIERNRKNYKEALFRIEDAIQIQDSLLYMTLNQSVLSAQKDYFQRQAEYDEYRLSSHRIIAGLVISVLALAVVSVAVSAYRKIREKQVEAERYMGQVSDMVEQMKAAESENRRALDEKDRRIDSLSRDIREGNGEAISEFRRQIGDLYRLKFNFLDEICRQYYSYGLTAAKQRKILKAVEGSISELSGDRDFSALESIVNTFKDDVMRKLREEFPHFKEEEFRLMCYWYAGFSSSAMSLLLKEEDVNAVYKKRSRLKGKIEKSGSPHKEFFIKRLSK